jgi:serine/threonine protein kinase
MICRYLDATLEEQVVAAFECHLNDCAECLFLLQTQTTDTGPEPWMPLLGHLVPATTRTAETLDGYFADGAAARIETARVPSVPPLSSLRYRCINLIGSGGTGDVWEARDQVLGRSVALKFLKHSVGNANGTQRLMQEAHALARLSNPHIVSVHEVQHFSGIPAIVMELVPGPSLAQYLRGRPCPPAEVAVMLEQLCQAVDHAHSLGVIHRDLKPSNVLLKPRHYSHSDADEVCPRLSDWHPKIADFGVAHISDQPTLTLPGQRLGTPGYMAPEQVNADVDKIGPATDVYGLGAILYELLTGRPPFKTSDPALTMAMILTSEPVPPRSLVQDIPRDLETICLKCLRKEPDSRYRDAEALRNDCLAFLNNRPISARPVSRPRQLLTWVRRHPAESAALITGFALLVSVTAGSLLNAHLSDKLTAQAQEKVRLLEETHSLKQQQQESVRSKFHQLLQTHHHFLQILGDAPRLQTIGVEGLRSQILDSAAGFAQSYIEMLDQKIEAGEHPTPTEIGIATDYLDLAFRAGARVDFTRQLPQLHKFIEGFDAQAIPPWDLLELKLRLESLNALMAIHEGKHVLAGQLHLKIADLIDQQLLIRNLAAHERVERLHVKLGMLMNALTAFLTANRSDLALQAVEIAENTTNQLMAAAPENQHWLAVFLQVRLRKSQLLPQADAARLAGDTLEQFRNVLWTSPQNAETAREVQIQLARLQNPTR